MKLPWKNPLEIPLEELDKIKIEEYIYQLYKEKLLNKPRRKKYWQREYEYRERVMKRLEELRRSRELFP